MIMPDLSDLPTWAIVMLIACAIVATAPLAWSGRRKRKSRGDSTY